MEEVVAVGNLPPKLLVGICKVVWENRLV